MFDSTEGIIKFSVLMGAEVLLLIITAVAGHFLIRLLVSRIQSLTESERVAKRCDAIRRTSRLVFSTVCMLLVAGLACLNSWMAYNGEDAYERTLQLIDRVPNAAWAEIGISFISIVGAIIAARIINGFVCKYAEILEARAKNWEGLKANDESLSTFFGGLTRVITNVAWIFVVIFTFQQLRLPPFFTDTLYTIATIYLIIAIGLNIVRVTSVVVDTLDGLSNRYAEKKAWYQYYESLRPLIPLFRKCLEYALWVIVGILVMMQLKPIEGAAVYGPRIIEIIGIFFIGRVLIEVGYLFIDRQVLGSKQLDEMERRRRETLLPLVKSIFKNLVYFVCFVLMFRALGHDPMPFLAGAGVLGVVIGLGAQPLINDIMSGFFIILEHIYLVGDLIEGNGVYGTVERIDFRTTKVRDLEGRLHIIRNGDMSHVVNYSKDYVYAVVDVDVRYDESVQAVMKLLQELGERLKAENEQVIDATEVFGILSMHQNDITIRTKTRVKPGCHGSVAAAYRLQVKDAFAERGIKPPIERKELEVTGLKEHLH